MNLFAYCCCPSNLVRSIWRVAWCFWCWCWKFQVGDSKLCVFNFLLWYSGLSYLLRRLFIRFCKCYFVDSFLIKRNWCCRLFFCIIHHWNAFVNFIKNFLDNYISLEIYYLDWLPKQLVITNLLILKKFRKLWKIFYLIIKGKFLSLSYIFFGRLIIWF